MTQHTKITTQKNTPDDRHQQAGKHEQEPQLKKSEGKHNLYAYFMANNAKPADAQPGAALDHDGLEIVCKSPLRR